VLDGEIKKRPILCLHKRTFKNVLPPLFILASRLRP